MSWPGHEEWLDAEAAAVGLTVAPAWRAAILGHLAVCLRHGAVVLDFPLPDDAEPAPVFSA